MAKAEERAEVVKAEAEAERVYQQGLGEKGEKQLAEQGFPVLYGNENFVQPRRRGRQGRDAATPTHTQEEWLVEAHEVEAVMARGDHVSPDLIEMLFLDALDVIEGFVPPATRSKKDESKREDEDEDKRNHKREEKK